MIFTPSERCLKKICLEYRFATTKDIKSKLESSDIHASERTVRQAKIDCYSCYESETSQLFLGPQGQTFGLLEISE